MLINKSLLNFQNKNWCIKFHVEWRRTSWNVKIVRERPFKRKYKITPVPRFVLSYTCQARAPFTWQHEMRESASHLSKYISSQQIELFHTASVQIEGSNIGIHAGSRRLGSRMKLKQKWRCSVTCRRIRPLKNFKIRINRWIKNRLTWKYCFVSALAKASNPLQSNKLDSIFYTAELLSFMKTDSAVQINGGVG